MSNSNALKSAINLTDNSITSDTLCNEHSPVQSIWWEDEHTFGPPFNPSDRGNQPPQCSWRQKATPDAHCAPLIKEDLNLRDLLRKKNHLLQNIALEYSRLVGLMQHEFGITGIEPETYAESMRSYDKAVDDYECFQIFTDSLVVTISQETDVNMDAERQALHRGTSYTLSPEILQNLTCGSLQNIVGVQEKERKCSIEVIDFTDENTQTNSRYRANSAPLEVFPAAIPCSATISPTTSTFRQSRSGTLETPQQTPTSTSVSLQPTLHGFFSLKSLSDSLPVLNTRVSSDAARQSAGARDGSGGGYGKEQLPLPAQPRCHLNKADSMKLNDLIAWKDVEIATVQNILRVNMTRAVNTVLCRKSRKAYRNSARENQKTLLRLYRESEELKEAQQSVLASRSLSVGRVEPQLSLFPHPLSISLALSPDKPPYPDSCHRCQLSNGNATTDSSYHTDGQSSDFSYSSTKQVHNGALATSCHFAVPACTFNVVPSCQSEVLSPPLCSNSPLNHFQDSLSDIRYQGLDEGVCVPKLSTNYVQYLFPDQTRQTAMRSYGRPNYSRHRTGVSTAQYRRANFDHFPRLCSNQSLYQTVSYHSSQTPLVSPQESLIQCAKSTVQNRAWPPSTRSSPTHFNKFPCGINSVSELEGLTSTPSCQLTPSEAISTSLTRPRFTLADKLNMCTTYFH
ncbi:conserved hypothetical protein [Echinococcus multilocularis]|uniref:Uncharacterized protein n=1 Tax=Echinococcus multilocularis TaxID=6211 RepID=A0A068Y7Q1_ECHMU|nr:conserved hypothetical protein [Echinococcus multilocularis]